MDLALKLIRGVPDEGRTLPLPLGRRFLLGRHGPEQGIDLPLLAREISRRHCEVWRDEAGVWVLDLQSRNGTLINGSPFRTEERRPLLICDRLQVGPAELRLVCLGPLEWSSVAVRGLAQSIREEDWQGQGLVLHDALIDADCGDADLLEHCKAGCPHGTDCSLLDLFLRFPCPGEPHRDPTSSGQQQGTSCWDASGKPPGLFAGS
jgi:hypothetical protein